MIPQDDSSAFAAEIADLHQFFQDWFTDPSGRVIDEFVGRLDPGFTIVAPTGQVSDRDTIVAAVKEMAGMRPVRITTTSAVLRYIAPVMLGTYVERHDLEAAVSERLATVGMVRDPATPAGFRWLFVHETWLGPGA